MAKVYADVYAGRIRDIQVTDMPFKDFKRIWSPTAYWMDVTGQGVQVGDIRVYDEEAGCYMWKRPSTEARETANYPATNTELNEQYGELALGVAELGEMLAMLLEADSEENGEEGGAE